MNARRDPDCIAGKHANCDGFAWNPDKDLLDSCQCECHAHA